jgi:hypothetical protein
MRKQETEEQETTKNCFNGVKSSLSYFDTLYFGPLFIRDKKVIEDRNLQRSESFAGHDIMAQETGELNQLVD